MKKIILLSLFTTVFTVAQSKYGIAYYSFKQTEKKEIKNKIDSITKIDLKNEQVYQNFLGAWQKSQNFNDVVFQLNFNDEYSSFEYVDKMESDADNELSIMLKKGFIKAHDKYNYFFKTKEIFTQKTFEGKKYLLKRNVSSLQWQLKNEQKIVGDYICYKAIATKQKKYPSGIKNILVTVWYTPSIPIPVGPYEFNGLPGLVVEVHEDNNIIYLDKLDFKKRKITPKKYSGESITEKEFEKIWRSAMPKKRN